MARSPIIDIHTHGIGRHDTRSAKAKDIANLSLAHGRAGTTAIVPTVYPGPIKKMRSDLAAIAEAMSMKLPRGSARILGAHLEGPFLNPARAGALSKESFIPPTLKTLKELIADYQNIVRHITIAPELPGAIKVIERATAEGIRISLGHSEATYAQAMKAKKAGAVSVTHLFNAMPQLHHREPGLAGFALMDSDIYIEVIADGIHVSDEMLAMVIRLKRPERIIAVSDSVKGPMKKGGVLQGGGMALRGSEPILKNAGMGRRALALALGLNAKRMLGIREG